jgi:hypothetical protein
VTYRKHSGGRAFRDEGMLLAGMFLIQRLEGSRLGMPTLWVLNGCADGEGREKRSKLSADVTAGLREQILNGVAVGKQATQAHR